MHLIDARTFFFVLATLWVIRNVILLGVRELIETSPGRYWRYWRDEPKEWFDWFIMLLLMIIIAGGVVFTWGMILTRGYTRQYNLHDWHEHRVWVGAIVGLAAAIFFYLKPPRTTRLERALKALQVFFLILALTTVSKADHGLVRVLLAATLRYGWEFWTALRYLRQRRRDAPPFSQAQRDAMKARTRKVS